MRKYNYNDVFSIFDKYYNNNIDLIDEPGKSVIMVISSKGLIDNGGFKYFFESDFPNGFPHIKFTEYYNKIGEVHAACLIKEACELVGDVVGLPYEHRKIRFDNNAIRLDELVCEFYKNGNQIDNSINVYSDKYCKQFHAKWGMKIKLLFSRLL